jgi:putative membrane protein
VSNIYLALKVVHLAAVISWMAGMLYLPRLYVYHAESGQDSPQARTFMVMERRLMRAIMLPALLVTWATGITLAVQGGFVTAGWFHGKVLLVVGLTALHGYFGRVRKSFAEAKNWHEPRFFRIINEVPTVLMVGILILVVFKPF